MTPMLSSDSVSGASLPSPLHCFGLQHFQEFQFDIYVGRNLWICDIHGSACAICGSIVCAEIHGCLRNLWIAQGSIYRFFIPPLPQFHFYELILLDKLPYVIGELFSKYQPGTKRTCLIIVILRQLNAVTPFSTLLRRRQSVILFRRL